MISRRVFLRSLGAALLGGVAMGGYAFGVEPFRLRTQRYRLTPPGWPEGLTLRVAALADPHFCRPWMSPERMAHVVQETHALEPDVIVVLGDYVATHRYVTSFVHPREWSAALGALRAPLGVHAILGNHDWWQDPDAQRSGHGPIAGRAWLEGAGIAVYDNEVVRLEKDGLGFWLAGLGDQLAFRPYPGVRAEWRGADDLPGTLAQITDAAPVILLAHEPDIFPQVPDSVSLTLSGHTHGGQVRLLGYSPLVPSRFGNRYAYGHVIESDRHLIVSGGLGCSVLPVRFGSPPEIVLLELGGDSASA